MGLIVCQAKQLSFTPFCKWLGINFVAHLNQVSDVFPCAKACIQAKLSLKGEYIAYVVILTARQMGFVG
jgi:hypothetical protein